MKIDARIKFKEDIAKELGKDGVDVPVDIDYVEADEDIIIAWIMDELENMFKRIFYVEDFKVTNMAELVEELKDKESCL